MRHRPFPHVKVIYSALSILFFLNSVVHDNGWQTAPYPNSSLLLLIARLRPSNAQPYHQLQNHDQKVCWYIVQMMLATSVTYHGDTLCLPLFPFRMCLLLVKAMCLNSLRH